MADKPKGGTFRDSRTGALRRSKTFMGYPYVGPLTKAQVAEIEGDAAPDEGQADQAGGAQAPAAGAKPK